MHIEGKKIKMRLQSKVFGVFYAELSCDFESGFIFIPEFCFPHDFSALQSYK